MAAPKKTATPPAKKAGGRAATKTAARKSRTELSQVVASVKTVRARVSVDDLEHAASGYFANVSEKEGVTFISSGCAILDAILGGGWACGRVINIVGDKSAGKTLLAIEACVNFNKQFPIGKGYIRYKEAEAAFDKPYAQALGMPIEAVDFVGMTISAKDEEKYNELKATMRDRGASDRERESAEKAVKKMEAKGVGMATNTVENLHADLEWCMDQNPGKPILYVIDSLDALSDEAEQERGINEGSYGGSKPKKMGEMFRRLVDRMEAHPVLFIVVSQLRDKLNVTFGDKQTRSGGRALDFYASQIVWLAEIGKISKTVRKVARVIGVNVRARVKKNKVGLPFRDCDYPILFGYGVDDLTANVDWLIKVGCEDKLTQFDMSKAGYATLISNLRDKGGPEVRELRKELSKVVFTEWQRIEQGFLPRSSKY